MSALRDFHMIAQEYLQLIAKKTKQASVNAEAGKELDVLNHFYDMVYTILLQVEQKSHELQLLSANEHIKAKILEKELKTAYNSIYRAGHATLLASLAAKTALPTKEELKEIVHIKNQQTQCLTKM